MPNILTAEVLQRLNIPTDKFNASFAGMMRAGMKRLAALQRASGGWGWFDRDRENPFMTAAAVDGLGQCQRLGYPVDAVVLERGRARLVEMARTETDTNRLAYLAYVLGEPDRRLAAATDLTPYAQALWVLTLHRAGKDASAAAERLISLARGDHWETRNWYFKWENVDIETTAYAIQALAAVRPKHPLIGRASEWLLGKRIGNRWKSTKDTAVAIATLLRVTDLKTLSRAVGAKRKSKARRAPLWRKFELTLNGAETKTMFVDLNNPLSGALQVHFATVRPGRNQLRLRSLDGHTLRFDAEIGLHALRRDDGVAAGGLRIKTSYSHQLERLTLGQEVTVSVTVSAPTGLDYLMITSPIPAGCEVIRGSGGGPFARFEARYEKALFFVRRIDDRPLTFSYKMRCTHAGSFRVLRPRVSLMYDEARHGAGALLTAKISK